MAQRGIETIPEWAATWIENWPPDIGQWSFAQRSITLNNAQAHALGRRNNINASAFEPVAADETLNALACCLDRELSLLGGQAFVRLGSRSPKDTPLFVMTGGQACSGMDAIQLLSAGSRRIASDLRRAIAHGIAPCIHLREWLDFPWWAEYRCFVRDGQLIGISQYHVSLNQPVGDYLLFQHLKRQIRHLAHHVVGAWGKTSVVIDVLARDFGPARLIELNPWGSSTGSCLFDWESDDFDGSLRIKIEDEVVSY